MANIGKKQIATYNNKVVHIVPEYNRHKPENIDGKITITKTSVTSGTYAKYSGNEQTEGMYIQAHTINDGHYNSGDWNEYTTHQLVAQDDLNYRFLLPTGEDNTSPTYNALLASCVNSSNTDRTISRDDGHNTYRTELTPSRGYSKVPAGRIEKQKEDGTWDSVYSWDTPSDRVRITIEDVDGNLRFVFDTDCVYELTVYTVIDGNIDPEKTEKIDKVCHTRITLADFVEEITGTTFIGVKDVNGDSITDEDTEDFCGNTSIYVNYTTNEYTVTNNIDPNCATVEISNPTPEYGDTVVIIIGKKSDKANIGAGSISMEGANNPIYSWNKTTESTLRYSIDSVIGNITIDSNECGDPANHPVQLEWYNDEEPESDPAIRSISVPHGNIIHPNDPNCTSTFTLETGYEIKYSVPDMNRAITITDDNTIIQYHYGLKEYIVTYIGDETVTINVSESGKVKHNEAITTQGVYTIGSGYQNATATIVSGTATGASANNGSVTVTGVTSNVTVKISADSIPTHNYCVSFSIDQAGTFGADPDKTSRYCKIIQEGTCHKDIPYSLNSGYEIYGEIPSQITINADNTIDVCNITEDTELVIPVRLVTHTVRFYLETPNSGTISQEGGSGQSSITNQIVHGGCMEVTLNLNSGYYYIGTEPAVTKTGDVLKLCGIETDTEVKIKTSQAPPQFNITYEIYKDSVFDKRETQTVWPSTPVTKTINVDNISSYKFADNYIDSPYENTTAQITSEGVSVSIPSVSQTGTVKIYLILQRNVREIKIRSSKIDAMGGIIFEAEKIYDNGDPSEYDYEQSNFTINSVDNQQVNTNVVRVYDYQLDKTPGTSVSSSDNAGLQSTYFNNKKVLTKTKLEGIENTNTVDTSIKTINVTYNPVPSSVTGKTQNVKAQQRGEQYGYYTDIESSDDTDALDTKLTSTSWKSSSLVDYGDSCNMYDAETKSLYNQGLDIYNKDITPYYITGTYIAENPLNHLDNNVKFYNNTLPVDYNKTNTSGYNDHYHITWIEQGPYDSTPTSNRVTTNMKGWVFKNDAYQLTSSICGGSAPECNCTVSSEGDSLSSISTLEAIDTELSGIERSISSSYDLSYVMPEHSYGRDSISYYHYKENSEYRTNVNDETFKDSSDNVLNFSYPVHIKSDNTPKSIPMNRKNGPGASNYATDSIRWEDETSHDSPSSYDRWDYTYYDYYNRIYPMFSETNSDLTGIHFEKYNQNYYNYDYDYDNVASIVNSRQLTDSESNDQGRIITLYSTFISMETMIRPVFNNGAKFATLDKKYNGLDNDNISPESREDFGVNNYVNLGRRTRYISKFFLGESGLAYNGSKDETLLTKQDDNDYGFDINSYPYAIESDPNIDYGRYYDNSSNEYTQATSYDLNLGYRNTHYNKMASISFSQYYNNPASNIQNYYAHNEDGAKYVICGDQFSGTGFYYLYDPLQSSESRLSNWKNICAEGIKSITYNNSNGTYTIVTNNSTYTDYRRNTADYYARYYHKELLNLGTKLYTNANDITVEFDSYNCDDPKYGLGTIELTDVNDSSKKAVWKFGSLPEFIEDNQDELALNLKVSSDYQDGNINSTKTGGGTVKITCQWRNNQGDLIDTRVISGNIGGSCDRDNNPNESGSYLTWTDLNNIYSEETGGTITPFTNTGRELYIVNLDNKYYDLKNNEEIQ